MTLKQLVYTFPRLITGLKTIKQLNANIVDNTDFQLMKKSSNRIQIEKNNNQA